MSSLHDRSPAQQEASLEHLPEPRHGMYTRSVQLTGIPARKVCPFGDKCECDVGPDDPCPVLTRWSAEKVVDLVDAGASEEAAEQIVRLLGLIRQGYAFIGEHGAFQVKEGTVSAQPALKAIGVAENSLTRLLRDTGLHRGNGSQPPSLEEYLEKRRAEDDGEEDQDGD